VNSKPGLKKKGTAYSQTREEQTKLTAGMREHEIFEVGSVDDDFLTKISEFESSIKRKFVLKERVSGFKNLKPPGRANMIEFAREFPSLKLTAPAIVTFDSQGYEHVPGFGAFQPIAKNRKVLVGDSVIGGLTGPLVQIQAVEKQIAWINDVYRSYGGYSDPKLVSAGNQFKADHDTINNLIEQFEEDPTQAFTKPNLPSLQNGTPALSYKVDSSPAYEATEEIVLSTTSLMPGSIYLSHSKPGSPRCECAPAAVSMDCGLPIRTLPKPGPINMAAQAAAAKTAQRSICCLAILLRASREGAENGLTN
jgi:hypothetical protein